jgi:hypothetical protein
MIDKLNSVSAVRSIEAAFRIIDSIQKEPKEIQLTASALLLIFLTRKHLVDIRELCEKASYIQWSTLKEHPQLFHAIQAYIDGELK